jgi:hypothetical protein
VTVQDEIASLRKRHPEHGGYLDELMRLSLSFENDQLQVLIGGYE